MPDARAYPSRAHPLHVILGAYPVACFTGAFVTDIVYSQSYNMMWADFSIWLISVGLALGIAAAVVGIADYWVHRHDLPRRSGSIHRVLNILVLVLSLVNAFVHSRDAYTSVVPTGLILSGIVAVLVLIASWTGSSLVYSPRTQGAL